MEIALEDIALEEISLNEITPNSIIIPLLIKAPFNRALRSKYYLMVI